MHRTRRSRLLLFGLTVLACTAAAHAKQDAGQWNVVEERWYALEFGGAKAGWTSNVISTDGQRFRTDTEMSMKISRGQLPIEIAMSWSFIETAQGKPVLMQSKQTMSRQSMETEWTFLDDHVDVISRQGGKETVRQQPLPAGEWLPPAAADRFARQQRETNVESFTLRAIDPQNGLNPIGVTSTRKGKEQVEVDGKTIDVTVWSTVTDIMPVEAIEKINSEGTMVLQDTTIPGLGKMSMRLTTKALAKGDAGGPGPELLLQTFVTPDKPVEDSMKATRAKLRLTVKDGKMPNLPTAGAQRVEMGADGKSAVLTIDVNDNSAASAEDSANKEYLAASAMVDSSDELIQKLAKRAADRGENGGEAVGDDPMRRAEALRRLARKLISRKGMETAFASASETAKMRTGDCSEHGVLLCALLRADGIPARVATGLIYADQFAGHEGLFGWHMWTQALIDGKWVDFDATLPTRYNAVHILTATSSLNNGLSAMDMAPVIQLIGNLDVEVLEVHHGEK